MTMAEAERLDDKADLRILAGTGETLRVERHGETHRGMLRSVAVAPDEMAVVDVGFAKVAVPARVCSCGVPTRGARWPRCEPCRIERERARDRLRRSKQDLEARRRQERERIAKKNHPTSTLCHVCKAWILCPTPAHPPKYCKPCLAVVKRETSRRRAARQRRMGPGAESTSLGPHARSHTPRRRIALTCRGCGSTMQVTRIDAKYCSNVCGNKCRKKAGQP
jgi:hypothetical protein